MEDSDIIALYKSGQAERAFTFIVRKYSERLYWHIRQLVADHDDADDILQETFIKVWNALPAFREDSKLYTWLYRIATNESLTFLKRRKLRATFTLRDPDMDMASFIESDPLFDGDELQLSLQKAIATLPPKQKSVFVMRYFHEIKYEDISEIMGISVGALKASYHHAFNKVQEYLKKEGY
jgi:RNA polymerase sigma-70 factor (ECF subfamily)